MKDIQKYKKTILDHHFSHPLVGRFFWNPRVFLMTNVLTYIVKP